MPEIRKGMCPGCPWNYGDETTETAYNLGCLPSATEAALVAKNSGGAWACHSEPEKVCCGFAAGHKTEAGKPLVHMEGVHAGRQALARARSAVDDGENGR